jgi:hypothetical protein
MENIQKEDRCDYENCEKLADTLVYDRNERRIRKLCFDHGTQVLDSDSPEYICICENCGCRQPIN